MALDQSAGPDLVFFNVAPDRLIVYPSAWAGPLAGLIGLSGIGVVIVGLRCRRLTWRGLAVGVVAFAPVVIAAAGFMAAGWSAITTLNPNARALLLSGPYNAATYQVGLVILGLALVSGAYALLGRWCRPANLTAGSLAWIAALMALTSWAPSWVVCSRSICQVRTGLGWSTRWQLTQSLPRAGDYLRPVACCQ